MFIPLLYSSLSLSPTSATQSVDDAREFLRVLDPKLGQPLPERDYAEDCSIYTPGEADWLPESHVEPLELK